MKAIHLMTGFVIGLLLNLPMIYALAISDVFAEDVTIESAVIKWKTDAESNSTVYYGGITGLGSTKSNESLVRNHSVLLTNLSSNSKYYFAVESMNSTDNKDYNNNNGQYYNFTTLEKTELYLNITNKKEFVNNNRYLIEGEAAPNATIQFYIGERMASTIQETGLNYIKVNESGKFSGTIRLLDGLNNITVIVKDDEGNRARFKHYVTLDKRLPIITLDEIKTPRNAKNVLINGSVNENSSIEFELEFDNKTTESKKLELTNLSFSYTTQLTSGDGEYKLIVRATDPAGNIGERIRKIVLDTVYTKKKPPVEFKTNFGEETHFTLLTIEGETEPNANVKVVNLGNLTNIEEYNRLKQNDTSYLLQIDPLWAAEKTRILGKWREDRADDSGYFSVRVNLLSSPSAYGAKERGFKNSLYFVFSDEAGNNYTSTEHITYKPGDPFWQVVTVDAYPTNVYMEDIRNIEVEASAFLKIDWIGGTKDAPTSVKSPRVVLDGKKGQNDLVKQTGRVKSYYNAKENSLYILAPIRIKQWEGTIDEYFEKLAESKPRVEFEKQMEVYLQVEIPAVFGEQAAPSAVQYAVATYAIQRPENLADWLGPEMINKTLKKYIEPALKWTREKRELVMEWIGYTTLACLAAITYNYINRAFGGKGWDEAMWWTCDRILCPDVPPKCDVQKIGNIGDYYNPKTNQNYYSSELEGKTTEITLYNASEIKSSNISWYKDAGCTKDDMTIISHKTIEKSTTYIPLIYRENRTKVTEFLSCTNKTPNKLNVSPADVGCYKKGFPMYDEAKCFWMEPKSKVAPTGDLYYSVRCGCLPGMYGYLNSWSRILEGMRGCLQQAMIGNVKSGLCERMLLQYACDVLTWVFMRIIKGLEGTSLGGAKLGDADKGSKKVSEDLTNRYGQTAIASMKKGVATDLIHKGCLYAFTGDISILEGFLQEYVKETPVKPYALAMGHSRQAGYDPFIGEVNINYNLYVGIVPGGPTDIELRLVCDRSYQGGEYCPATKEEIVITKNLPRHIERDDLIDVNIPITVSPSSYWYNKMVLKMNYILNNQVQTETIVAPISRRGDLAYGCEWHMPFGPIVCKPITIDEHGLAQLMPTIGASLGTRIAPDVKTFYPKNPLYILAKIKNNYDEQFYISVKLIDPTGKEKEEQYRINPAATPNEIQYYNLNPFSFGKAITPGVVTETKTIYKGVLEKEVKLVKKVEFALEKGKGAKLDTIAVEINYKKADGTPGTPTILNVPEDVSFFPMAIKGTPPITITKIEVKNIPESDKSTIIRVKYIKEDGTEKKEILSLNTLQSRSKTKDELITSPSGRYTITIDVLKDTEIKNGLGDTAIPYNTENQKKSFEIRVSNMPPEGCPGAPVIDIVEPTGDFIPLGKDIPITANIIDDCNVVKNIKVSIVDEKMIKLGCEIKKDPDDDKKPGYNYILKECDKLEEGQVYTIRVEAKDDARESKAEKGVQVMKSTTDRPLDIKEISLKEEGRTNDYVKVGEEKLKTEEKRKEESPPVKP